MEPMLPQSLGGSDSEILGVGDVMMNSPDMNAGLMPATPPPPPPPPPPPGTGLQPAFISLEFTTTSLALRFLSLTHPRTLATLLPYCP